MPARPLARLALCSWAPVALAHPGKEVFYIAIGVFVGIPALGFLFIPWHQVWARLVAVGVLIVMSVVIVNSRLQLDWLYVFTPSLSALATAISLRLFFKRRYPPRGSFPTSF